FFLYIFIKPQTIILKDNYPYESTTGNTCFNPTIEGTSCTGGTITDICVPDGEQEYQDSSYIITFNELRSCNGFRNVSEDQTEEIINTLYQLSTICYRSIINE
ncbi:MAG: hypothetical protein ACTSRU_20665, partial [Candidatus Hodarchaeales archaeon]